MRPTLLLFFFQVSFVVGSYYNVPCASDENCPSQYACTAGHCAFNSSISCDTSEDCPRGSTCGGGSLCVNTPCQYDWQCDNGYWCNTESGDCEPIQVPIQVWGNSFGGASSAGLVYQDATEGYRTKVKVWGWIAGESTSRYITGTSNATLGFGTTTWEFSPNGTICDFCAGESGWCAIVFSDVANINSSYPTVKCWGRWLLGSNVAIPAATFRNFSSGIEDVLLPTGEYALVLLVFFLHTYPFSSLSLSL